MYYEVNFGAWPATFHFSLLANNKYYSLKLTKSNSLFFCFKQLLIPFGKNHWQILSLIQGKPTYPNLLYKILNVLYT